MLKRARKWGLNSKPDSIYLKRVCEPLNLIYAKINPLLPRPKGAKDAEGMKKQIPAVRAPFQREPDFDVVSVNYSFAELLERGELPR